MNWKTHTRTKNTQKSIHKNQQQAKQIATTTTKKPNKQQQINQVRIGILLNALRMNMNVCVK